MSLPMNHPAMEDVQDRIHRQLVEADEKLTIKLKEQQNSLQLISKARQVNGVELFTKQQQLQQLNDKIMLVQKKHQISKLERQQNIEHKQELLEKHIKLLEHYDTSVTSLFEIQNELKLKNADMQLLKFAKNEVLTHISNNTEEFNKSSKDVLKYQSEKIAQDYFVNNMIETSDTLSVENGSLDLELKTILKKITSLKHHAKNSENEMKVIALEKKQVLVYWNSSLKELEQKQLKLQQIDTKIGSMSESKNMIEKEINQVRNSKEIKTQELDSSLSILSVVKRNLSISENSLTTIQNQIIDQTQFKVQNGVALKKELSVFEQAKTLYEKEYSKFDKLSQQRLNLDKSLQMTKESYVNQYELQSNLEAEEKQSFEELQHVKNRSYVENNKLVQLEAKYSTLLVNKSTLEVEMVILNNEKLKLTAVENSNLFECTKKEKLELQNAKEIGQNLLLIGKLNEKICQNTRPEVDESPIQLIIKKTHQEIDKEEKIQKEIQQEWIKTEKKLITQTQTFSDIQAQIQTQKKDVEMINMRLVLQEREIELVNSTIKTKEILKVKLMKELDGLNMSLFASDVKKEKAAMRSEQLLGDLKEKVFISEMDLIRQKQLINSASKEKTRILKEMNNLDEDVAFWKMKVHGLKETQKLVNPKEGGRDLKVMEIENHKLELDLQQVIKQQQQYIKQMNQLVDKRQTSGKTNVKSSFNISVIELEREVKKMTAALKLVALKYKLQISIVGDGNIKISQNSTQISNLKSQIDVLVYELAAKQNEKKINLQNIIDLQYLVKQYQSIKDDRYKWQVKDTDKRQSELHSITNKIMKIEECIAK